MIYKIFYIVLFVLVSTTNVSAKNIYTTKDIPKIEKELKEDLNKIVIKIKSNKYDPNSFIKDLQNYENKSKQLTQEVNLTLDGKKYFKHTNYEYKKDKRYYTLRDMASYLTLFLKNQKEIRLAIKDLKPFYIDGKKYYYQYETYIPSLTYHQIYLSQMKKYKRSRKDKLDFFIKLPTESHINNIDKNNMYLKIATKFGKFYFDIKDLSNIQDIYKKMRLSNEFYQEYRGILKQFKKTIKMQEYSKYTKRTKLQQNETWNMAWDNDKIYVVTRDAKNNMIEIYDKKTLNFLSSEKLRYNSHTQTIPIGVDNKDIYIGNSNYITYLDKNTLQGYKATKVDNSYKILSEPYHRTSGIKQYKNFIITYGEGDYIFIYKNHKLQYSINQKKHYPINITEIKDYSDYNRVNDVYVHKDRLYSVNWRGFINIYNFSTGEFISQINTIKYEKEWDSINGTNIQDIAVYKDRYVYFSQDYEGVLILDTKTRKTSRIKTLFPKDIQYSKMLKEDIDMTKATNIFQMLFYKDNLIFSEVNARNNFVYVYSLSQQKIIHTFKGHSNDITEILLDNDRLVGLSYDGYLYEWNLKIIDR